LGYYPQVILSGRRVNDNMGMFIANKAVKLMIQNGVTIKGASAVVLGISFKENCPDIRNSKVIDIYKELKQFGLNVEVYDPFVDKDEVLSEYKIEIVNTLSSYDLIILAVAHSEFNKINYQMLKSSENSIIFDIKSKLDRGIVNARL
jgi:UDP-N-acetyl-D-galactosamine dehydrogenase